jgi:glycosyltransferase involved in cell wall biosynthesis
MKKPRLLFIADIREWAYDDAALHWQEQFRNEYDIDIIYLSDFKPAHLNKYGIGVIQKLTESFHEHTLQDMLRELNERFPGAEKQLKRFALTDQPPVFDHREYDGLLFFYSKSLRDTRLLGTIIPFQKTAVYINNEKWTAAGEQSFYEEYIRYSARIILCNNQFIYDRFSRIHPETCRVTQGVDPLVFNITRSKLASPKKTANFIMGWSGNYTNPLKNIEQVKTCCEQAGVKLVISKNKTREELNKWYNRVDALICLSESEGGPLMLLEGGACGLPVITKSVGLAREIITHNETGILVPDNNEQITEAIQQIVHNHERREMLGHNLHTAVMQQWTYEKRREEIATALKKLIS